MGVVNEPTHVATAVFCIWTFVTNNRRHTDHIIIIGMPRITGLCPHFVNAGDKLDQGDGKTGYWLVEWVVQHL